MKQFKLIITGLILGLILMACSTQGDNSVSIKETDKGYQLIRNGKPYFIKGAGGIGHYKTLAEAGGNSIRTWGVGHWEEAFKNAEKYDLTVFAGIWLEQERQGFDYSDSSAVAKQFERIKKDIMKYKDHPNLLMWGIGNEMDLNYTNPKVWDAVEQVAKYIHKVDGKHPTATTTAFIEQEEVKLIKERCPNIDILSVNAYAGLSALAKFLDDFGWEGPYLLGEWGTHGHWEVQRTSWDEPIEFSSKKKANLYKKEYNQYVTSDPQSLGGYVFLWGQKQERTPTWYSMFLPNGNKTQAVDVMFKMWQGQWPQNRAPILDSLRIDGLDAYSNVIVQPGSVHNAKVWIRDPDNDSLEIKWELLHETRDKRMGGDEENKPPVADYNLIKKEGKSFKFKAPQDTGAYRLFVYVYDRKGSGAHANIPFYVENE